MIERLAFSRLENLKENHEHNMQTLRQHELRLRLHLQPDRKTREVAHSYNINTQEISPWFIR